MKLFYYLFGIVSTLFVFMMVFNFYAAEFIDEYWLTILYHNELYLRIWSFINLTISIAFVFCAILHTYNTGKNKNNEPLIIKVNNNEKDDEEIKPYL